MYLLQPPGGEPSVDNQVIRVGLNPPPVGSIQHGENPNAGCFDDVEGDDSVEWVFYEAMMDALRARFCIDPELVFASGSNSGSLLTNELVCRYAGNTRGYAIRGIAANGYGLPGIDCEANAAFSKLIGSVIAQ